HSPRFGRVLRGHGQATDDAPPGFAPGPEGSGIGWETPTPDQTLHPNREKIRPSARTRAAGCRALKPACWGLQSQQPLTALCPPRDVPPMAADESVSHWLNLLQSEGDTAAAQRLWERYFHRLVGLARAKLQGQPRRAADEEDVALSAFANFCRAVEAGRFPRLADRHDLWRLLVTLTERKAYNLVRDERRQKRGGGGGVGGAGGRSPRRASPPGVGAVG